MSQDLKNVASVSLTTVLSRVTGLLRDVLIFAALGASASKAINYFTHSRQYGPILTGFSKPAAEISRGTYAGDIFGTAVMVASHAIDHDLLYPTPDNALNEDIRDILKQ